MLHQVLALGCYLTLYLLPGLGVVIFTRANSNIFLLSFAVSVSTVSILLLGFQSLGIESISLFSMFVLLICLVSVVIILLRSRLATLPLKRSTAFSDFDWPILLGHLLITIVVGLAHFLLGPYTEIPSDFWKQLARVNAIFLTFGVDSFSWTEQNIGLGFSGSSAVYFLHAGIASLIGSDPLSIASSSILASTWLFLSVAYFFTTYLARSFGYSSQATAVSALLATLFVWLTFGTATFSFVRYYAYFPVMLAFPLIYCSVMLLSSFLDNKVHFSSTVTLLPLFFLAMWVIHHQEAMLAMIILALISLVRLSRMMLLSTTSCTTKRVRARFTALFFLFGLFICLLLAVMVESSNPWGHTPHIVNAGKYLALLDGYPVDNPTFRLWDTIGIFGIVVYVWSAVRWRLIFRNDFLVAGLCVPLFTNLNPFFAMFFLTFGNETTLWRTAYLVPLGFVAGFLVIDFFKSFQGGLLFKRTGLCSLLLILLLTSIYPWQLPNFLNRTSKLGSFLESDQKNGYLLWSDLIMEIRRIHTTFPIKQIITDSVTGFVINAAVRGTFSPWQAREYFPKNNGHYASDFLGSDFSRSLLVVNKRDGKTMASSSIAGHWSRQVLEVSKRYPESLLRFVKTHTDLFELIWERDKISIYAFRD